MFDIPRSWKARYRFYSEWVWVAASAAFTLAVGGQDKVPVKQALAKSYGVFNKLFTASPTMSWPNHMFTQSGTSCGALAHSIHCFVVLYVRPVIDSSLCHCTYGADTVARPIDCMTAAVTCIAVYGARPAAICFVRIDFHRSHVRRGRWADKKLPTVYYLRLHGARQCLLRHLYQRHVRDWKRTAMHRRPAG